jgi:hypothetical protein
MSGERGTRRLLQPRRPDAPHLLISSLTSGCHSTPAGRREIRRRRPARRGAPRAVLVAGIVEKPLKGDTEGVGSLLLLDEEQASPRTPAHDRNGRAWGVWSTSRSASAVARAKRQRGLRARCASAGSAVGSVRCALGRRSHDRLASARCRRSEALAGDARCPATTPAARATKGGCTPRTRRPWRRSSP